MYSTTCSVVVTEKASHVHVDLLFFDGLLLLLGGRGVTSGSGSNGGGSGGTTLVGNKVSDVLALESLGEKTSPVSFNVVVGGLDVRLSR